MQRNPHSYQIATGYRTFYSLSLIYQPITKKRLFLNEKDNGYTLKEDFIIEKLWPDNSGNDERMHKAIGRLRSFLRKIDPSLSIINKNGTYRLIISEKSLVKRNS